MSYTYKSCEEPTPIQCDCCNSTQLGKIYFLRDKPSAPKSIICSLCHMRCRHSMTCEVNIPIIRIMVDGEGAWTAISEKEKIMLRGRTQGRSKSALEAAYHVICYFGSEIKIVTNVLFLFQCFTNYIYIWRCNGWLNSNGYPVKNGHLIYEIDQLNQGKTKYEYKSMRAEKYRVFDNNIEALAQNQWQVVFL